MPIIANFSNEKVRRKILDNIRANYRSSIPGIKREVKRFVDRELNRIFYANHTVQSIRGGQLTAEFGLQDPSDKLRTIRAALVDGIKINVSTTNPNSVLSIRVEIGAQDFSDVLAAAGAYQEWTGVGGNTIKGPPLPWLQWLLLEGDHDIIISDYVFTDQSLRGRSGFKGIMIPQEGGGWRVPEEFAGNADGNFIIDVLTLLSEEIDKRLWQVVRPVLTRDF